MQKAYGRKNINRGTKAAGWAGSLGLIAIIIVIFAGVLFANTQLGNPLRLPITASTLNVNPESQADVAAGYYNGPITPVMSHINALVPTTTLGEGSLILCTWLKHTPDAVPGVPDDKGYTAIGANGNTTWTAVPDYRGVAWLECTGNGSVAGSSGTRYLDVMRTLASDYVSDYGYIDYDGDALKDHVIRINYASLPAKQAGQTAASLPISTRWYTYQLPSGAVNEPSADLVNVGNSQNSTTIFRFRYTFANFDRAALVREFKLSFNDTNTAQYLITEITVSFRERTKTYGQNDPAIIVSTETNKTYTIKFANNLGDRSDYVINTRTGGQLYVDVVVKITWIMVENASITLEARYNFWDDDEVQSTAFTFRRVHDEGPAA